MTIDFTADPDRTVLGTVFTRAGEEEFALSETERLRHMLVIGKTGMGKSTLLKNILLQQIYAGLGVGLIDPHGDLARELLDAFPRNRARDLVWIDPTDRERVVTFNPLANVPLNKIAATASNVVGAFHALWGEIGWGARMERILYFGIAALMEGRNASLLALPRFLSDDVYRADVLRRVDDPIINGFFANTYATWDEEYRANAIEPVLNKIEPLLSSPDARATLGTPSPSIDFGEIMDDRKVVIANLSKAALGEGHSHLFGAMLVSGFSNAAMQRVASNAPRIPFSLAIDEFQNFTTNSFATILSEARKTGLGVVLSHQYTEQEGKTLRAAVLGNVGTIVAFQLSGADADIIAREINLNNPDLLTALSVGETWAKHPTYGGPYHPVPLPARDIKADGKEPALRQHRLRNTYPRGRVEATIHRFLSRKDRLERATPIDRWPRSLHLFRSALTQAIKEDGGTVEIEPNGATEIVADVQQVRAKFIAQQVSEAENADDRRDDREKEFRRALRLAQQRRLIGAVEREGTQWVWRQS